jgi:hypothetical protein
MKFNTSLVIITVAFVLSLGGFIISVMMPQNDVSDILMVAGLFSAAGSGLVSSIVTKKMTQSRYWIYILVGGLFALLSLPAKYFEFDFAHQILLVSGVIILIIALTFFNDKQSFKIKNTKWVWFFPVILLGYLFKYMRWPGANIIIVICLLLITIVYIIQFFRIKKYSWIKLLLLLWMISMCGCIGAFTLRYITSDYFVIGSIFTWLALLDILIHHEKNMLEDNEFN